MGEAEVQDGRGRQLRQSVVMVMAMALVMLIHMVGVDARKWIVVDACFVIAVDPLVLRMKDLVGRLLSLVLTPQGCVGVACLLVFLPVLQQSEGRRNIRMEWLWCSVSCCAGLAWQRCSMG